MGGGVESNTDEANFDSSQVLSAAWQANRNTFANR